MVIFLIIAVIVTYVGIRIIDRIITLQKHKEAYEKACEPIVVRHEETVTMRVTTYWNTMHDAAALAWDYRHGHSMPCDPLNEVFAAFYRQDMKPFLYTWWDENSEQQGLLVTPTLDLTYEEVRVMAEDIVDTATKVPQHGEWRTRIDELDA